MSLILKTENLSKRYRIGKVSASTIVDDLKYFGKRVIYRKKDYLPEDKKTVWALRDITFEVTPGDKLGIIGKNGAGKSTLLKILSKITSPTSGKVSIRGRIAALLEVGTGFHPELTGRENIFLNGAILGMTRQEIKRKFEEIVDFSGIEKYIDTPVKRYSSGMYVRLGFAIAAHLEPDILIVDEVLAVGDIEFQRKCLGKMGESSAKQGRTVLFVSHQMSAVRQLCNKGIVLDKGQLIYEGKIQDCISEYTRINLHYSQKTDVLKERADRSYDKVLLKDFNIISEARKEETNDFYYLESINFNLTYESEEDIKQSALIISFIRLDGEVSASVSSMDDKKSNFSFRKGEHSLNIKVLQTLAPGSYSISLFFATRDGLYYYDKLENVAEINILNHNITDDRFYPWNNYGHTGFLSDWKILD